jgi:hypothetical protein
VICHQFHNADGVINLDWICDGCQCQRDADDVQQEAEAS